MGAIRLRSRRWAAMFTMGLLAGSLPLVMAAPAAAQTSVFINEIHYDNTGTDAGESIEVAGPAGTDLTGWTIVLYNGTWRSVLWHHRSARRADHRPRRRVRGRRRQLRGQRHPERIPGRDRPGRSVQHRGAVPLLRGLIHRHRRPGRRDVSVDIGVIRERVGSGGQLAAAHRHRDHLRGLHLGRRSAPTPSAPPTPARPSTAEGAPHRGSTRSTTTTPVPMPASRSRWPVLPVPTSPGGPSCCTTAPAGSCMTPTRCPLGRSPTWATGSASPSSTTPPTASRTAPPTGSPWSIPPTPWCSSSPTRGRSPRSTVPPPG